MHSPDITDKIFNQVKSIISNVLKIKADKIHLQDKLIDDLGADSIDIISLTMEFEDEFDYNIPDSDIQGFQKVQDIVEYIITKKFGSKADSD
jgi:acyl carrier protein